MPPDIDDKRKRAAGTAGRCDLHRHRVIVISGDFGIFARVTTMVVSALLRHHRHP
jgi:hypothetical protein